jgi:tagatose-1,6-bisphosphate aldolase
MYEALEEVGLNYIERVDKKRNLMYGCESTQYMVGGTSKLTSDRNSLIVGRAIRICHGVLIHYKYDEENINDTMSAAQRHLNEELSRSNIPKTVIINIVLYQTKEDEREENAHCDIAFTFPNFTKRFIVTIWALRPESALPPAIAERLRG